MESIDTKQIIREVFEDTRTLTPINYSGEGYLFKTENEIVFLDSIINEDFDVEKLLHYIEIAESLNKEYFCRINIYLILSEAVQVTVKEMNIHSEADFTIKVHQPQDASKLFLKNMKEKVNNNIPLTEQEIELIQMLPVYCNEEDRHQIRKECLKILNKANNNAN